MISLKRTWMVLVLALVPAMGLGQEPDDVLQLDAPSEVQIDNATSVIEPTPFQLNSQKVDVEKRVVYIVKGIENARTFNGHILVDKVGSAITYEPTGFVRIKDTATSVTVKVTDVNRNPVEFETWQPNLVVIRKPGRFWVQITIVDFTNEIFKDDTIVLDIGKGPDTPDVPDVPDVPDGPDTPDTPSDLFDGLASKIASFKSEIQIDRRNQVIIVFETAADRMQSFQYRQLRQAIDYILENRPSKSGDPGLAKLYKLLATDSKKRNLSWEASQLYYREIAKGLR